MKPKSVNALMAHMRDEKNIEIKGSSQKRKLRNMGYFHGYKGYRYCNSPDNKLPYDNFNQIQAVYDFDMKLKTIFYSRIMFVETAIKNYSLEVIIDEAKSSRFADIYATIMNDYRSHSVGSRNYKAAINERMNVRNRIYSNISRDYGKNNIINYYYDSNRTVPIWAIFEILSLGEFGKFIKCLNQPTRVKISQSIGLNASMDTNGRLVERIVFVMKDLRNSVAHNNMIFDTRFKSNNIGQDLCNYISSETGISGITFKTIVDYLILIAYVMKILKCNKTEIMMFIHQFEEACEDFRKKVPVNIYSKIVYTDTRKKLNVLENSL
ncbi:MAG: Abi family protein [Clostridia bacterium]|nr:Abi family protein [Clostridia bacterium]